MLLLIQWFTKGRNDWKQLEEATGIKAVKWRHFQSGVIRPSIEMLESLCKLFPEHAFWLSTGLTDYEAGHTAPHVNVAFPGSFGTFFPTATPYSTEYFRTCLSALDAVTEALIAYFSKSLPDGSPMPKAEFASLFKESIRTSLGLTAGEVTSALGMTRHREITERVVGARKYHIEVMLERLREIGYVDKLIDEQRLRESEIEKQFSNENSQETKK
ncbi:hypothetical protein [Burkholderia vietnamiensis]|uniref:hypothetical protein n=1 Tax=Burkholderia vietnamiensis TaxID=60552 RepID=UPI000B24B152|nr:hypothetical protein [Burkholderia vietnamiensis]